VFHLEIRQRPHQTRAFNLTEEQLQARFLAPFLAGETIVYDDREWEPRKAKLTVIQGPELRPDQIGMGRGWHNATRGGTDVTERMLAAAQTSAAPDPAVDQVRERLIGRLGAGPVAFADVVALAGDVLPGRRASERLAASELAVWELLHRGGARLVADAEGSEVWREVPPDEWEPLVLRWETWASPGVMVDLLARPR
jgi:hypothetical protein